MALKGFQNAYKIGRNCNHQIPGMLTWAENPSRLPAPARLAFVENVAKGIARENVYSQKFIDTFSQQLTETLIRVQNIIPQ